MMLAISSKRRRVRSAAVAIAVLSLVSCASLGTRLEPPDVVLVGVEPLPSGGNLEQRLLLRLRVTNPNDRPLVFDGVDLRLDVNGRSLGRAVGNERIEIPRLDSGLVELTATAHFLSIFQQMFALAGRDGLDYALKGRIFLADSPGWLRVVQEGSLANNE